MEKESNTSTGKAQNKKVSTPLVVVLLALVFGAMAFAAYQYSNLFGADLTTVRPVQRTIQTPPQSAPAGRTQVAPSRVAPGSMGVSSFTSSCGNGLVESGETCDDGNVVSGDGCSYDCKVEQYWMCGVAGCQQKSTCSCVAGYVRSGSGCVEANPCSVSNGGCDGNATCTTTSPFSASCKCSDNFYGLGWECPAGSRVVYDSCTKTINGVAYPVDTEGTDMECVNGQIIRSLCGDGIVDPLMSEQCDDGNNVDGDGCTHCKIDVKCDGVGCAPGFKCNAQSGSCVSVCGNGVLDPGEACDDGNSVSNDGCSSACQVECNRTCGKPGSLCSCDAGTQDHDNNGTCTPNCATSMLSCGIGTCSDLSGTASCVCPAGYQFDGKTCSDVNECLTNNGGCDVNATCANTIGSLTCACKSGYSGDGKTCSPVNSCLTSNGGCSANATCASTGPGTNTCACKTGYSTSDNGKTCNSINSCSTANGGCAANATCTSTGPGTNLCSCPTGYSTADNGKTCTAVNSCLTNNGGCSVNATCTSTGAGTNSCACKTGYSGNGTTCTVATVCGDGVKQTPNSAGLNESCDKTDFGNKTCATEKPSKPKGSLTCSADCKSITTPNCKN